MSFKLWKLTNANGGSNALQTSSTDCWCLEATLPHNVSRTHSAMILATRSKSKHATLRDIYVQTFIVEFTGDTFELQSEAALGHFHLRSNNICLMLLVLSCWIVVKTTATASFLKAIIKSLRWMRRRCI